MTKPDSIARLAREAAKRLAADHALFHDCNIAHDCDCADLICEVHVQPQVASIIEEVLRGSDLASNGDAVEWLKKVHAMGISDESVVPQQNAGEMLVRLDELGFGKQEGRRGNTLMAMVMDAADEIESLRGGLHPWI